MRTIIITAMLVLSGGIASAQENAAAASTQTVVQAPASPAKPASLDEIKSRQKQAMAELKKQQKAGIKQLKASMKGKPSADIKKAVKAQEDADETAVKALEAAQKAEIDKFQKEHKKAKKKSGLLKHHHHHSKNQAG